jgi:hypothetical protein
MPMLSKERLTTVPSIDRVLGMFKVFDIFTAIEIEQVPSWV